MGFIDSEKTNGFSDIKIGFQRIDLKGDAVYRLKSRLEAHTGPLELYDASDFTQKHVELMKKIHQMWEWKEIIEDNADQINYFAGIVNLLYQKEPYLRIARTGRPEDNIGIHRDTHYGASDKEWVLWVPLTNATRGGELRLIPASHKEPDERYPWVQVENPEVEKGSDKHWLGFRYAPKKMSPETEALCVPVPCFVGEAILFNCACVHGQIVNKAPWTRFSIDIRLADEKSDIQRNRGLHGDLYARL